MDFLELSLRMADRSGARYRPYSFDGPWSTDDMAKVSAAIDPHVPAAVDSGFNNWVFWYYADIDYYSTRRATWDRVYSYKTVEELATFVEWNYTRND
jgi:hypothetical protein